MGTNDEMLTVDDAVRFLRIGKTSLYKLLKKPSRPPFITIGRRRMIRKAALLDWIQKNEGKDAVM